MTPSPRRLWLYLSTTYPPLLTAPFAAISYLALAWSLLAARGLPPRLGRATLAGILGTFLFLLFLRVSDELKDSESDKIHFPERLLPSGRITPGDLWLLWWVALAGLIGVQLLVPRLNGYYLALLIYGLLMFRYFFLPRLITSHLFLALLSHNPSAFLLQLCALGWLGADPGLPSPFVARRGDLLICLLFYLPALLWELSRKLRRPSEETQYQTYSSLLGPRRAALLTLTVALGMLGLVVALGPRLGTSILALAAQMAAFLLFAGALLRFIIQPEADGPKLGMVGQAYAIAFYAIAFCDLALRGPRAGGMG
ncbi:MAG: UbiA family prenyltransferase [Geothrix sp.]|uniref:UbiA family prenyltransferase n=1 Tax=Geothrix sp. TaxID=1962974 RepID=UPI0017D6A040|nr:UbiA family prenyltransferase [Geothrix sp.]NWJ42030.1 UbiA family prenyltransferase [Geothrix sp.]WIL20002.1 MAG: UbiA family prenyltransferase [Geothrix sp.]